MNTVGKQGKLGAHIRCVVSVSMLTEGWDANTVTHILGIRKFGSQLLCEQVAGRALRRVNYQLVSYDKEGIETKDKRRIHVEKFPPEYAYIIGVPFKLFKKGKEVLPPVLNEPTKIYAIREREKEFEITFPNVVGYRVEIVGERLNHNFEKLENFFIDCTKYPLQTEMIPFISEEKEKIKVEVVLEKRKQEIIYNITKQLLDYHFCDSYGNRKFFHFGALKKIVEEWYDTKIEFQGENDEKFKKLVLFYKPKVVVDHIRRAIYSYHNNQELIRPVLNYYNRFGSTKYVLGQTTKEVFATDKSHVNYVVCDTELWEQVAAKTLEELEEVQSYVKNTFLNFSIPYSKDGKDRLYYPDFIVRIKSKTTPNVIKNLILEITGFNKDKEAKR